MTKISITPKIYSLLKKFLYERLIISIIISILLISFFNSLNFNNSLGVYPGRFWFMKLDWKNNADVVLAGDSRTCCGLSPMEMERNLPNKRILNYAFDGNGYSSEYLQSMEKILANNSDQKIIILGISPRSLTVMSSSENHFTDSILKKRYHLSIALEVFDKVLKITNPIEISEIYYMLFPSKRKTNSYWEYSADGWMGRCIIPSENYDGTVEGFRQFFLKNPVSPKIINNIMCYTKKWIRSGIKVYAFRPPTIPEMVEMENFVSMFNEKEFISNFEAVGGTWIKVKQFGYATYDGSHLCPDGATEFSYDFSKALMYKCLE